MIGEKGAAGVTKTVTPWPSDHRAVVSSFDVTPAETPEMIATTGVCSPRASRSRSRIERPTITRSCCITPQNDATTVEAEKPLDGRSGRLTYPGTLEPGAYDAVLSGDGKNYVTSFWIRAKDAKPRLSTDKGTYKVGEPIKVSWVDAPANRWDWLGVYKAPADTQNDSYLIWQYTGGKTAGTLHGKPADTFTLTGASTYGGPWPLPPGQLRGALPPVRRVRLGCARELHRRAVARDANLDSDRDPADTTASAPAAMP